MKVLLKKIIIKREYKERKKKKKKVCEKFGWLKEKPYLCPSFWNGYIFAKQTISLPYYPTICHTFNRLPARVGGFFVENLEDWEIMRTFAVLLVDKRFV